MSIRISNKKKYIDQLNYIIGIFRKRKFDEPVKWVSFIRDNIKKEALSNYKQDFNEVQIAYETVLRKKGGTFYSSYEEILKIFNLAARVPPPQKTRADIKGLLEDVTEFALDFMESRKQINHISELVTNLDNDELKYYLYCFIYLVEIEGGYRNWIRMLFYLLYNVVDGPITLEQVEKKSLSELRNMMVARGMKSSLFEYYMDGNLRHAIAHAGFSFDNESKKMRFENKWKNNDWEKEYTLKEFFEIMFNISIISDIATDLILILMVKDICFVHVKEIDN